MRFADETLQQLTADEIRVRQETLLRHQLYYCWERSSYYRRELAAAGAEPGDIRTLEDFRRLPVLMTKEKERASQQESLDRYGHPFGMHLCCRTEDLLLTSTTSGTTGTPTFTYTFSRSDLEGPVADLWAHLFRTAGVRPGDRVLFAYALGVYATSMLLWGIRRAGALPIDVDVRGGSEAILQFAELTRPTVFATTPSLAEHLIQRFRDPSRLQGLGLRSLLLCGEPGPGIPQFKARLERAYSARVYDYWAPGGLGFGMSCDCAEYHGLHCYAPLYNLYQDDLVDPDTKQPIEVRSGAVGEAVHTSLQREACPVLRYAYGDLVRVETDACPHCGFAGKRLYFVGRTDDMLIVKGSNVYPSALQQVISSFTPRTTGEMRVVLRQPPPRVTPPLELRVEYVAGLEPQQLEPLAEEIIVACRHRLKVTPCITWVPAGTLERTLRKTPYFEKCYE